MATIRKKGGKETPAISTASLPDIIFMLLFFFMVSTSMKEVDYMVNINVPQATELQKLDNKSLIRYVYVGVPQKMYQKQYGTDTRIQLDDAITDVSQLQQYVLREREAMNEDDQDKMTVAIKADRETKMGIITDIKQALRRAYALKINYEANKRTNNY